MDRDKFTDLRKRDPKTAASILKEAHDRRASYERLRETDPAMAAELRLKHMSALALAAAEPLPKEPPANPYTALSNADLLAAIEDARSASELLAATEAARSRSGK